MAGRRDEYPTTQTDEYGNPLPPYQGHNTTGTGMGGYGTTGAGRTHPGTTMPRFQYGVLEDETELQMEPISGLAAPSAAATAASAPPPEALPAAAATEGASAPAGPAVCAPPPTDGVFANIQPAQQPAMATEGPPKYDDERLPTYGDVYTNHSIVIPNSVLIVDDILVDGLPVGSGGTFILNLLVAWFLGIIGFLCAFFISRTHAGRRGAQAGLGLQCINIGIYMRSYMTGYEDEDESEFIPVWMSYVFLILGWFVFFRACASYFKARQILHAQLSGVLAAV